MKPDLEVGDIVKNWKIVDIYFKWSGQQNVSHAKIVSLDGKKNREIRLSYLKNGKIAYPDRRRPDLSERNLTHGMSATKLYSTWSGMKNRCLNKRQISYKDYGGRGIKICDDWLEFENFKNWAMSNGYSEDLTLDRVDTDGNYCPKNCKWATKIQQTINKRNVERLPITAFGETKDAIEWLHDDRCHNNISIQCLRYRINAGWDSELALTKPPERKHRLSVKKWLKSNHPDIYEEYLKQ
jgi:hypothetical protein